MGEAQSLPFCLIRNSVTLHFLSSKAPKGQGLDAHERAGKIVAKRQRHPLGAAKCEFPVVDRKREVVRNSHFDIGYELTPMKGYE